MFCGSYIKHDLLFHNLQSLWKNCYQFIYRNCKNNNVRIFDRLIEWKHFIDKIQSQCFFSMIRICIYTHDARCKTLLIHLQCKRTADKTNSNNGNFFSFHNNNFILYLHYLHYLLYLLYLPLPPILPNASSIFSIGVHKLTLTNLFPSLPNIPPGVMNTFEL